MKIKRVVALAMTTFILFLAGCEGGYNKQFFDTNYKFNYAYIKLQDGTLIQGEVESWTDFEDGDQLQIRIKGKVYLVHSCNCTLIYDPALKEGETIG